MVALPWWCGPRDPAGRHNRHSVCSPSGSNYSCILKECWPLRKFCSFLKSPAAGSERQTSHIFRTDLQGGRRLRETKRGSLLIRKAVQKHPVPLSYILFYTLTQRVRVQQVKAISSKTSTWDWPWSKPKGGWRKGVQSSLTLPRARVGVLQLVPQTCTCPVPTVQLAAPCHWYRSVLAPIVLVMMQTGPPTAAEHNSPLVCHACDQSC